MDEITENDIKRYSNRIGCFVNVDYLTLDGRMKAAKGKLEDVKNNKLFICDTTNPDKLWEVHISSIQNFNSKTLKEVA